MGLDREMYLELQDTEWPYTGIDHDREIVRAVVLDNDRRFWFVRAERDDEFGRARLIETSGGGVEPGEDLQAALLRELKEELGIEAEILCSIGLVSDYYNLIRRHNLNHYFLCRVRSQGERHLTKDEAETFHLSTLRLSYEEAVSEYEACINSRLGRLIAQRELPVLRQAIVLLEQMRLGDGVDF